MKTLFNYCVKVDWNEEQIVKYASSLGLTYEEIRVKVLNYAEGHVDKEFYDEIIKKLNSQRSDDEFLNLMF